MERERERERVQNNKQVYKLWTGDFDITSKTAQQTGDRQKKRIADADSSD